LDSSYLTSVARSVEYCQRASVSARSERAREDALSKMQGDTLRQSETHARRAR